MAVQATTIETVTVVRPLKVISSVCLFIALILLILCLSTTWWLRSDGFRTGLWLECTASDQTQPTIAGGPPPGGCQKIHRHAAFENMRREGDAKLAKQALMDRTYRKGESWRCHRDECLIKPSVILAITTVLSAAFKSPPTLFLSI
ncbi:unnamed protein product [Litomosoides sigmodontis]|uniref:Uncharacterized protein n=1 Tax=Litomosoides sigmodontis TaxID=42156 RepID=A0A3P6TST3_LITSI|nr:unnamed protein product [Litomosoides sigmodontis]